MNKYATILENGNEGSRKEALELYIKAANTGYIPAYYNLGYFYEMKSIPRDKKSAYLWYRKALEYDNSPRVKYGLERTTIDLEKEGVNMEELDES